MNLQLRSTMNSLPKHHPLKRHITLPSDYYYSDLRLVRTKAEGLPSSCAIVYRVGPQMCKLVKEQVCVRVVLPTNLQKKAEGPEDEDFMKSTRLMRITDT